MSETRTFARPETAKRASPDSLIVPQWALNVVRPGVRLFSQVCWRLTFEGVENIPARGGVIIASNHQTYIDPFWISIPIKRRVRYLAWNVAFGWPLAGKAITLLGAWPLQLEGSDPAAIRRTLHWLRGGGAIMIFPEGGRCGPDGALSRFKVGAIRLALEANVPILPVTIRGAHRVWPRGWHYPHFSKVEILYHPLLHVKPHEGEDSRVCARRENERLAHTIGSALSYPS